ncbi:hypothetical protein DND132_2459 [Pseudodesulfovibrio mercurii]|uniref:Uncharacterized protein n=1 Tax=Pseudodesulfovibrio mercurii TaxID=641491 RepID=F0JCI2_9BACT|nr:hypothetical protein [Pseudodesulfovibrio mercurii]EGB15662.1 hypothetical protein DND132_2459 [Pseudodesulfovibrio mercurii]
MQTGKGLAPRLDTCVIGCGGCGFALARQTWERSAGRIPGLGIVGTADGEGVHVEAWPDTAFSRSLSVSLASPGGRQPVDLEGLKLVQVVGNIGDSAFGHCSRLVVDRMTWAGIPVLASCVLPRRRGERKRAMPRSLRRIAMRVGSVFLFPEGHVEAQPGAAACSVPETDVIVDQLLFSASADGLFFLRESTASPRRLSHGRYCVYCRVAADDGFEFFGTPGKAPGRAVLLGARLLAVHLNAYDPDRAGRMIWAASWESDEPRPDTIFSTLPVPSLGYALAESVVAVDIADEAAEAFVHVEVGRPGPVPGGGIPDHTWTEEELEIPAFLRRLE